MNFQIVRRLNLRHLRRQWLRASLGTIGIAMGVATFILAITITNTLYRSMAQTVEDFGGRATVEVRSAEGGFSPDCLPTIRQHAGVAIAAPTSLSGGLLLGQAELMLFFGVDPVVEREVRQYTLSAGTWLNAGGEALLTQAYAAEKDIALGDTLTVLSAGGLRRLTVVGFLGGDHGTTRLNSGDLVVMPLEDAFAIRGEALVDAVSIIPQSDTSAQALISHLDAALPENLIVTTPLTRTADSDGIVMVANILMSVIGVMLLSASATLIYNTVNISIVQRRAEIGIMRALGMTQTDIQRLFVGEAAVLGMIGALIGVGLGFLVIELTRGVVLIPEDFTGTSLVRSDSGMSIPVWLPFVASTAGVILAIVAGYIPSRAISRIDPVEAMMQIRAEVGSIQITRWRLMFPLGLIAFLVLFRLVFKHESLEMALILANIAGVGVMVIAVMLFTPALQLLGKRLLPLMQRLFGISGALAVHQVTQRSKRMATTGMFITFVVFAFTLTAQSNFGYTDLVSTWNTGENVGDLTIIGAGANPISPNVNLSSDVLAEMAAREDVAGLIAESVNEFNQHGTPITIRALEIAKFREAGGFFVWRDGDEASAYERLTDHDKPAILVATNNVAIDAGVRLGGMFALEAAQGTVEFEVIGLYLGGITDDVRIVMDQGLYEALWQDRGVDRVMVQVAAGMDVQGVRRDLMRDYALRGVVIFDQTETLAILQSRMTSISNVSSLLVSLVWVLALVALGSTFFIMVLDRRRELGMMRALGLLRRQLNLTVILEGLLLFVIACMIGIPTGILAISFQQISMEMVMGIAFTLPLRESVINLGLLLLMSLVALYIPARTAANTPVLEAMRYE